jgi:hypothetical protein
MALPSCGDQQDAGRTADGNARGLADVLAPAGDCRVFTVLAWDEMGAFPASSPPGQAMREAIATLRQLELPQPSSGYPWAGTKAAAAVKLTGYSSREDADRKDGKGQLLSVNFDDTVPALLWVEGWGFVDLEGPQRAAVLKALRRVCDAVQEASGTPHTASPDGT